MNGERCKYGLRRYVRPCAAILLGGLAFGLAGCSDEASAQRDRAPLRAASVPEPREAFAELERSLAEPSRRHVPRVRGEAGRGVEPAAPFPVDVPRYPGARMFAALEQNAVGRVHLYVTPASPDRVEAFYLERLAEAGWHQRWPPDDTTPFEFERDGERLRLSIEARSHGTLLSLAAPVRR